jgi:hypothetical protein
MISSAPSAAREKPFVSGWNSVKQAGGHTDLGATDSPLRDGFRSPQLAGLNQGGDRPTSMRLGCEPVRGVRPGIRSVATQEAVTSRANPGPPSLARPVLELLDSRSSYGGEKGLRGKKPLVEGLWRRLGDWDR